MTASNCSSCSDTTCSSKTRNPDESADDFLRRQRLQGNLCRIKHIFFVLSGKGGVGKSTVAANLALSLGMNGYSAGLLDIDLHGPSIPTMLGLADVRAESAGNGLIKPVELTSVVKVMSVAFLLQGNDDAVIWRGPMKAGVIEQLVADVDWGPLDALVVDCPPGTGDEPLSIVQTVGKADGAIIVTTPQQVATADVRRSISFCHRLDLPVLGVIENMSGFVCPHCNETTEIFSKGGGETMAADMGVPFLGRIPIDPELMGAGDRGVPYVQRFSERPAAKAFSKAILPLIGRMGDTVAGQEEA
ncbi:MAG TPA: Mrp/NBP35 family ATP-binding protein [Candidatus Ozemobacteraceae bacterium]|nr:Mrp/NBP35 family ATP-binding protein [Candidatus Ozemobacteraceae bacterium]